MNTSDALKANKRLWNEWTDIHEKSEFYDLEGFKRGRNRLHPLEIGEVGDVSGKSILHMQCHFGLDTLSWARMGASVTGIDFSDHAITLAKSVSRECNIDARFIETSLYDLPKVLEGQFDIVFTSYGAITWLPDIKRWAQIASSYVKPGGFFYVAEFHPFAWVFDDEVDVKDLRVRYDYFHQSEPLEFAVQGSYADSSVEMQQRVEYDWQHTLGDIITALIDAGLRIEFLHEHRFSVYKQLPFMEKCDYGYWRIPDGKIPLMFSIKARKG